MRIGRTAHGARRGKAAIGAQSIVTIAAVGVTRRQSIAMISGSGVTRVLEVRVFGRYPELSDAWHGRLLWPSPRSNGDQEVTHSVRRY
jgi:hypothetical protein